MAALHREERRQLPSRCIVTACPVDSLTRSLRCDRGHVLPGSSFSGSPAILKRRFVGAATRQQDAAASAAAARGILRIRFPPRPGAFDPALMAGAMGRLTLAAPAALLLCHARELVGQHRAEWRKGQHHASLGKGAPNCRAISAAGFRLAITDQGARSNETRHRRSLAPGPPISSVYQVRGASRSPTRT